MVVDCGAVVDVEVGAIVVLGVGEGWVALGELNVDVVPASIASGILEVVVEVDSSSPDRSVVGVASPGSAVVGALPESSRAGGASEVAEVSVGECDPTPPEGASLRATSVGSPFSPASAWYMPGRRENTMAASTKHTA